MLEPSDSNRESRPNRFEQPIAPPTFERQQELFIQALQFEDQNEQIRFLESQCGDDQNLLNAVDSLIRRHHEDSRFLLDEPLFDSNSNPDSRFSTLNPGDRIDGYQLEQRIAEGGMGEVWVAMQSEPVTRRVALKLVKSGRETPGIVQRFEIERQALAAMDHPGIARVFDGGTTQAGQPYFVMELVNGLNLTRYCDETKLSIRQRLGLFVQIALAVEHAHQKAVIHRDLKPSNILVTIIDGQPVPKVIDFGLAKAVTGQLVDDTKITQFGSIVGTLDYMAPEQAGYSGQDVDTRADIYSLGVILYELMTGMRPFESKQFRNATVDEKLQIIKDDEPTRPSAKISTIETAPEIAKCRQTNAKSLNHLLRHEIDWIVMKALEKDRNRRHQSAGDFAADVRSYLNGDPIQAHPPSTPYRIKKYLNKHRSLAFTALLVTSALILGIAGITYGLFESRASEKTALKEKAEAEKARNLAQLAAEQEARQRTYSQAVADFLIEDFLALTTVGGQLLEQESPSKIGRNATLRELLDRAASKLRLRTDLEPEIKADLMRTIGASYRLDGEFDLAIKILEECCALRLECCPEEYGKILQCHNSLAVAYQSNGQDDESVRVLETVLDFLPPDFPRHHLSLLSSQRSLSDSYAEQGKFEQSRKLIEPAYYLCLDRWGRDHPQTIRSLIAFAWLEKNEKNFESALEKFEDAISLAKSTWGDAHPLTVKCMNNYGATLFAAGKLTQAVEVYDELFSLNRELLGDDHTKVLQSLNNMAAGYWNAGQLDKSIPLFKKVVELYSKKYGDEHSQTVFSRTNLAVNYRDNGQLDQAIELFEQVWNSDKRPQFAWTAYRRALVKAKRVDQFKQLVDQQLEQATATIDSESTEMAFLLSHVGNDALTLGELELAEKMFRNCLEIQEKTIPDHWHTFATKQLLGTTLLRMKNYHDAKPLLESAYEGIETRLESIRNGEKRLAAVAEALIQLARQTDNSADLAKWTDTKSKLLPNPVETNNDR